MTCELPNKLFNRSRLSEGGFPSVGTGAAQIYIWLEFNGPWRLLLHGRCGNQTFLKLSNRPKCPFFCPFEMCDANQMGLGLVCINLFLLRGPRSPCNEYMGHWVPLHNGHSWCGCHRDTPTQRAGMMTYGPNLPSRWTPNRTDRIEGQNPTLAIYPCLLISW